MHPCIIGRPAAAAAYCVGKPSGFFGVDKNAYIMTMITSRHSLTNNRAGICGLANAATLSGHVVLGPADCVICAVMPQADKLNKRWGHSRIKCDGNYFYMVAKMMFFFIYFKKMRGKKSSIWLVLAS